MGRGKRPFNKSGSTPIRLPIPDESRGFKLTHVDGLVLVAPAKIGKSMVQDWPLEERAYRSIVIDEERKVVSAAFPKFFNFGEDEHDTAILMRALASGERVWHTTKEDGSLLIRSVINGRIVFRTRATLDGGPHGAAALRIARSKYPILLDPSFASDISLLFELVSPTFRIVLSYEEEDLILVGAVEHATLRQADFDDLQALASQHDLNLVSHHELPTDPEALVAEVNVWKTQEGIVVRCNEGQTLVKLKAADYLARHRLRFALSARAVREICLERDVQGLEDFEVYLKEVGGDWELVEDAKPLVEAFCAARARAQERLAVLAQEVEAKLRELPSRKDFALEYATRLPGPEKSAAFALADGRREQAYAVIERSYLDEAFKKAEERDELLLADLDA